MINHKRNKFIEDLNKSFWEYYYDDKLSFISFYSYFYTYAEGHIEDAIKHWIDIWDEFGAEETNKWRLIFKRKLIIINLLKADK